MDKTVHLLNDLADQLLPQTIDIRRHLHSHPELSGKEAETSRFIASQCRELGLAVDERIGGHGLLARLEIDSSLPYVALRADMDALPIHDGKSVSYSSATKGVSHACGHDAHSAILLGTANMLCQLRHSLPCNVAFIFQPAEETTEGAAAMIGEGVLERFDAEAIYAMHVYPYLPAGSIGCREGAMCAAADMFEVTINGRGGHAARPHECIDVILVASHIIQALHHIVSRRVDPLHPAVLTIGQIEGGHAANVIPDSISFSGTVRSLNTAIHEEIRTRMDHIIRQTAETWGATASFRMRHATPALHNDADAVAYLRRTISQWLPDITCIEIQDPSMGGEDFAEFLQHIPGCLMRLGTGATPETRYPLHHPCFDIDERALRSGMIAMAMLCLNHASR